MRYQSEKTGVCIMGEIIIPSLWVKFQWWVIEKLAKYGFSWLARKARNWINKQLESKLEIIDKPEAIVQSLNETGAYLWITLHIWSAMPSKLQAEVKGTIKTEGFEAKIDWNKMTEKISNHKIQDIESSKNSWAFSIYVPLQVLKNNISANWYLNFIAVFQNKTARTFTDIKFKIRTLDVELVKKLGS